MNLNEGVTSPIFGMSPSGSGLDAASKLIDPSNVTPRCWKTIYYLLDLYATMPDTKTISHR